MAFDLYVWHGPRDLTDDAAAQVVEAWQAAGGDPATSPFEPSTDVGWFYRELMGDQPALETATDAVITGRGPIVLAAHDEPPARVVAIRAAPGTTREAFDDVYSLAMKYDLVLYDARARRIHRPLDEMAAYASATFWPRGAIRAAVAGLVGLALAIGAWIVGIPILSIVIEVVGLFLVLMSVLTFVHEGRVALRKRGGTGGG